MLKAVGLPELITNNLREYEKLAVDLATNPDKLKIIKDKLTINKGIKPLFDTPRYTKNLEKAYLIMYKRYMNNLPVSDIVVTD